MSSFVISKPEFVKAAGLMFGIENAKSHSHRYFLENVRKDFVRAYELNVASVNEQYGEDSQADGLDYDSTFDAYCVKGEKIYHSSMVDDVRRGLMMFFRSVLYQIENEEMHQEVAFLFYACIQKLYSVEVDSVDGWWGEIEC